MEELKEEIEKLKRELEEQREINSRILDAWEFGQSYEDFMNEEFEIALRDDKGDVPF